MTWASGKLNTYPDHLVLRTSGEELPVGAEADTPNVEVSVFRQAAVLEMGDGVTGLDVEDLCRSVATGCDPPTVQAEADAAHYTLMGQVVNQVNVENSPRARVEDGEPIATLLLQVLRQLFNV